MFYTYVMRSKKDNNWYTGCTAYLQKRFKEHSDNKIRSTKGREPFEIIYSGACANKQDAFEREKYLKTGMGKRYLKNRLKRFSSLTGFTLIEILVILAVLSILLGLILSGGTAALKRSKIYRAKTMIASLETALALYHTDFGDYPIAGNQNLVNCLADTAAYSSDSNWHGPYLSFKDDDLSGNIPNATLIDSWGIGYYYTRGDSLLPYKIWSRGPDGIDDSGGNDDIKSW